MTDLYGFRDYKAYLSEFIRKNPAGGRGFGKKLADAARCRTAYISQVLRGDAQLSLEQAESISRLLGHTEDERGFFFLLIQFARAGTPGLSAHFQRKLDEAARLQLSSRLNAKATLTESDQVRYYSAWHYMAVHMALTVDALRTPEAIAAKLGLALEHTSEILGFLQQAGLAVQVGTRFRCGKSRLHLRSSSPLVARHHSNWRMRAIEAVDRLFTGSAAGPALHFSAVATLSAADAVLLKERLMREIRELNGVMEKSPAEGVHCFALDFFEL